MLSSRSSLPPLAQQLVLPILGSNVTSFGSLPFSFFSGFFSLLYLSQFITMVLFDHICVSSSTESVLVTESPGLAPLGVQ